MFQIQIAKWIVLIFGIFLILIGFLMLFSPKKARETLRKAGSTNLINYTEISIRMIPAAGLILAAEYSKFSEFFKLLGWFMLITSLILFAVPRKLHHSYSVKCAAILKPFYFQVIAPFSFLFGGFLIYAVL